MSDNAVSKWMREGKISRLNAIKAASCMEMSLDELLGQARAEEAASQYNVETGPDLQLGVPLISWVRAGEWCAAEDPHAPGDADDWIPAPRRMGARAFALRVRGESMRNPHGRPSYEDGDIIFVDPDIEAKHRDRVIVRLDGQKEATFKQLIIEGDRRYLKALNPSWPEPIIEVAEEATICGVVMGKWVPE